MKNVVLCDFDDKDINNTKLTKGISCEYLIENKIIVKIGEHGKKAKKIFQNNNIPPWERKLYPLIYLQNKEGKLTLATICNLWYNKKFLKVDKSEEAGGNGNADNNAGKNANKNADKNANKIVGLISY